MCDYWQRMENSRGDLADIVRSGSRAGQSTAAEFTPALSPWPPLPFSDLVPGAQNPSEYRFVDPLLEFFDAPLAPKDTLIGEQETMKSPPYSDDLPRVFQISPPPPGKPSLLSPVNGCSLVDLDHGGAQILSPQQTGIKRRKNQAKKVVCIPAPIAANSKTSTGELVPSDLWAWRKYGQKPIKGSPYPRQEMMYRMRPYPTATEFMTRGYYRCSSSKGCLARKQVERSRTDPNMLVITYTSEHNHPWPTQRNALAGSTRYRNASKSSPVHAPCVTLKEEGTDDRLVEEEEDEAAAPHKAAISDLVSEEDDEFDQMVHRRYKPMIQPDEFFAGFAELEADPVSLIFSKMTTDAKPGEENASLDSLDMFYWEGSS